MMIDLMIREKKDDDNKRPLPGKLENLFDGLGNKGSGGDNLKIMEN